MALNVEPEVLGAEIGELSKINITIQTNGCRVVNSTGDSLSCQSPGIACTPPKRKKRPENGMNEEACNSQKPSLQSLHYKACNESVSLVTSLQASARPKSMLGDNLTQNDSRCSGTVNNSNGEPSIHFPNNEVSGPSWSRDGGPYQRPDLVSPHPSTSSTSAEDDLFIAGSASNRFVSQKLRSHGSEEVSGFIHGDGILLDIDHSSANRSGGLRSTLEGDSDPRREVVTPPRSKSSVTPNDPLVEASAVYRLSHKQKIESSNQNPLTGSRSPSPMEKTQSRAHSQSKHPKANSSDVVDPDKTSEEPVQITHTTCCRLPFNGHIEDKEHYRVCQIVIYGIILREEHASWLNTISCSNVQEVVDCVLMSSCKQILLSSKCTEVTCKCKHTIDINFEISPKLFNVYFGIFTKWFLENAEQPNFRAILIILSRLTTVHDNVIMIVLSYAMMILKLPNKMYRQTLCIKLVKIMVSTLGLKPWEAVRTLLVFTVTPETGQSEILDLLSSLEVSTKSAKKQQLKNNLYQSVSCLWHISNTFVCPSDLIFNMLKECSAQMPKDLKLTKDRILTDLLKLPRRVLCKGFHLIDKFLNKYYPMNSEIVRVFRSSVLYGKDVSSSEDDRGAYESCRVKSTGPVNPHWDYWDVQEAQAKAFESCLKNLTIKQRKQEGDITFPPMPNIPLGNDFEDDARYDDMHKILGGRSYVHPLRPHDLSADLECLVKSLRAENFDEVAKMISSFDEPHKKNSLDQCMKMLQREFENCNRAEIHRIAIEIFCRLQGLLSDENSTKSAFVRMLNSLVLLYYKNADYTTALKLIKSMRIAGVNHLEHVPEEIDQNTFIAVSSHIHFQARLYPEAIRTLMYKNCYCLSFLKHPFDGGFTRQLFALEVIVKNMLKHFLKKQYADLALNIFRIIFLAQKDLRYPLDIGKYYEGVIFLSFVSDLKKNACAMGDGANLYITVDRICGNDERFHSITYRSLLVELHRVDSPEDIIRRVLWICLQRRIYPDFSEAPISPLVLESCLAKEEISIYLKHYFTFFIAMDDHQRLTVRPFVVRFSQSPTPKTSAFPVPNDIMKTPRTLPEALERFKSALDEIHPNLDADFSEDRVTIPVQGVEKVLDALKPL